MSASSTTRPLSRRALSIVVSAMLCGAGGLAPFAAHAADKPSQPTMAEVMRRLDALAAENRELKGKVDRLEAAQAQQGTQVQQQSGAIQQQAQAVQAVQQKLDTAAVKAESESATTVSGYGEIAFSHPTQAASDSFVNLNRAVISVDHQFDDKTRFVSEFEWENAIASADDTGEAEVEQFWVEHGLSDKVRGRVGLFLMPVGLINQNHEPTAYYGVFRPDVDTKIVPSTWREVGVGLNIDGPNGLNYDMALVTLPNLSAWDPESTEARLRGPLQSIHGEGQWATARDAGVVAALNWRGIPGLLLGTSATYGNIGQDQPGFFGSDARLTFLDLHARYQAGGWDIAGEFERGRISHTEALNADYAANVPDAVQVPALFQGGYVQAAYKFDLGNNRGIAPFLRYEAYNTASNFGSLAAALQTMPNQPTEHLWTFGMNYTFAEGVVLKADFRHYDHATLPDTDDHFDLGNSLNFGFGLSF